jgi:RNA polymerase sigma factor for flagellar operon FliA
MGASSPRYPRGFRKVLRHADRFSKVLVRLEGDEHAASWVVGRSGELRAFVSCAIADWRAGVLDHDRALDAITSYVDGLHRGVAKRLRCGTTLECCMTDDAVTSVPGDEVAISVASSVGAAQSQGPTVRAGWVDGPEVLERFHGELARVEIHARVLARRLGTRRVTVDDLRGFGREGLLDAARSFDDRRGVPFLHWATLRIRSAMIDGVRCWGGLPRRVLRELQAFEMADAVQQAQHMQERDPKGKGGMVEEALGVRPAPLAATMMEGRAQDEAGSLGEPDESPEDLFANAERRALLRELVAQLPDRERKVVESYYFGERTLKEIAAGLGATESWASRVLARAVDTIHRELRRCDGVADRQTRTDPKP